jgi:ribosome biogenesis GTPase
MNLSALGFSDHFARAYEAFVSDTTFPARVIAEAQHVYRLAAERGEVLARVSGRFRHQASGRQDYPAVGDWVVARLRPENDAITIDAVLPRTSRFSRKVAGSTTEEQVVAANVDTVFLVMGLDSDFSPRRLERYLALAWPSCAVPVVLLNKADVAADLDAQVGEIAGIAVGTPVHVIAARESRGLEALEPYLAQGLAAREGRKAA